MSSPARVEESRAGRAACTGSTHWLSRSSRRLRARRGAERQAKPTWRRRCASWGGDRGDRTPDTADLQETFAAAGATSRSSSARLPAAPGGCGWSPRAGDASVLGGQPYRKCVRGGRRRSERGRRGGGERGRAGRRRGRGRSCGRRDRGHAGRANDQAVVAAVGREKAMTATCVILPCSLARTCPVLILDEVEPRWKKRNLDRFLALPAPVLRPRPVHRDHASEAQDGGGR